MEFCNFLNNTKYLDFHTHQQRHPDNQEILEIISLHLGQQKPKEFYSIGLHPWYTHTEVRADQIEQIKTHLSRPSCVAIGEIGLDKLKGSELGTQQKILAAQLEIASDFNMPVIIHCVRAYDQLLKMKKSFPKIKKWCVHGYGRNEILAQQLIDQGYYLSFMPSKAYKYKIWFESLPINRLFLETDSMPNVSIIDIYNIVTSQIGLSLEKLQAQMIENAKIFFVK